MLFALRSMFHRDVLVVTKWIKMEFVGKKSIRFSAPFPSLLFWKESSLYMYELNTRWETSRARNLKTSEHLQLAFATPKNFLKNIWFTLIYIVKQFRLRYGLIQFQIGYFRFHLREYHHFQSLHRASNYIHRAPHNVNNTCYLLSLFTKRISFLTSISVYCTSDRYVQETNFRCERSDSKLRTDHSQLCVIFGHIKFKKTDLIIN